MTKNFIAIGDIHGRADLLDDLLNQIPNHPHGLARYKLVFLGDYVDRGPDSFKVVDRIKRECEAGAIALRGNHEDLMLDYHALRIVQRHSVWTMNGGTRTMDSYCKETKRYGKSHFFEAFESSGHASWIKSLPYYHETESVFFSHAPIPKQQFRQAVGDFRLDVEALTWSWHGHFEVSESEFAHEHGKLAVCGHVHALKEGILIPRIYPHIIYADTGSGCAAVGPLTGIIITDGKYNGYMQAIPDNFGRVAESGLRRSS